MANKIQIKRGLKINLPILDSGEPGFCTDTGEVFFGDGSANHQVVMHNEYNANTILAAITDNTPAALTIAEQRIVGRKTGGNITDLTNAEIMAILSGGAAADFSMNSKKITTLATPTADTDAATKLYVDNIISTNDAMVFKGTIGLGGTVEALPTTHDVGWTYRVITADTYADKVCEIGDMLISLVSREGSGNTDADWSVFQTNIDGAVTGPSSATDERIAVFNGISGKVIKDGGVAISELATSTHVHGNITNDGKIGSTPGLVIVTTADGVLNVLTAGSSGQFLAHDATFTTPPNDNTATAVDDILDGSNDGTAITYAPYSTSQAANASPRFYTHATNPSGTSRLNVSSYFYATQLYDDGIRVLNQNSDIDCGSFT
jgi:hypothetical protein